MLAATCATGRAEPPASPGAAYAGFVDVIAAVGLDYRIETHSGAGDTDVDEWRETDGGLTLADVDADGRLELYVAHGYGETGRLFAWDGHRCVRYGEDDPLIRHDGVSTRGWSWADDKRRRRPPVSLLLRLCM